jgi:hypothetical protein
MRSEVDFLPLYEKWAAAVAEADEVALGSLFDPSYSYTSPDGQRMSRAEIMELEMQIPPPQLPFHALDAQQVTADVAIVRGRHGLKGDFPEGVVHPKLAAAIASGIEIAFTSVWHHSASGWHVVSNDAHVVRDL